MFFRIESLSIALAILLQITFPLQGQDGGKKISQKTIDEVVSHVKVIKDPTTKADEKTKRVKLLEDIAASLLDELIQDPMMPQWAINVRFQMVRQLGEIAAGSLKDFDVKADARVKQLADSNQLVSMITVAPRLDAMRAEAANIYKSVSPIAALSEAITMWQGSFRVSKDREGLDSPNTIASASILSELAMKASRYDVIKEYCTEILPAVRKLKGEDGQLKAIEMILRLALANANLQRVEAAKPLILEADNLLNGGKYSDSLRLRDIYTMMCNANRWILENQKALSDVERAIAISKKLLGEPHPDTLHLLALQGEILRRLKEYERSEAVWRNYLSHAREVFANQPLAVATGEQGQAVALLRIGRAREALPIALSAVETFTTRKGENDFDTARSLTTAGLVYQEVGDFKNAKVMLIRALAIRQQLLPSNHEDVKKTQGFLDQLEATMKK